MKGRVVGSFTATVTIEIVVKELTSGHVVLRIDGDDVILSEKDHVNHTGTVYREWDA